MGIMGKSQAGRTGWLSRNRRIQKSLAGCLPELLETRRLLSGGPTASLNIADTDDQISEATFTAIGAVFASRAINPDGDVDMYGFAGRAGQRVGIDVDQIQSTLDSYVRLFDENGIELATNDNAPGPGETPSASPYLEYTFTADGTYYLGVSGAPNFGYNANTGDLDISGSTGSYRLILSDITVVAPPNDPDDEIGEATDLDYNMPISAVIAPGTDVDMFKFTAVDNQKVAIDVDRVGTNTIDSFLRIFDPAGNELAFNDNASPPGEAASSESYLAFTFLVGGDFYVAVSGSGNAGYDAVTGDGDTTGSTGAYTIQLTSLFTPPIDVDDQISEAVTLPVSGNSGSQTITNVDPWFKDVDMYSFDVGMNGQRLAFDVDPVGGSALDSFLRIFDDTGTELAFNDNGPNPAEAAGNTSYLEFTFPTSGTYYIAVSGAPNIGYGPNDGDGDVDGSQGAYTLIVTDVTPQPDTNDQTTEAIQLVIGGSQSGTISPVTDVDMYKFTATAGQMIGIDVDRPVGSVLDSFLRLFDNAGNQISFSNDNAAPGEAASADSYISFTVPQSGQFFVGVSSALNNAYNAMTGAGDVAGMTTGDFSITVFNMSQQPPPNVDPDDQISEASAVTVGSTTGAQTILDAQDVDVFKFTVPAGRRVAFDMDRIGNSPIDGFMRLFNSAGTQLAMNDNGPNPSEPANSSSYIAFTFASAGTYYVAISGAPNKTYNALTGAGDVAGSTGDYQLILTRLN